MHLGSGAASDATRAATRRSVRSRIPTSTACSAEPLPSRTRPPATTRSKCSTASILTEPSSPAALARYANEVPSQVGVPWVSRSSRADRCRMGFGRADPGVPDGAAVRGRRPVLATRRPGQGRRREARHRRREHRLAGVRGARRSRRDLDLHAGRPPPRAGAGRDRAPASTCSSRSPSASTSARPQRCSPPPRTPASATRCASRAGGSRRASRSGRWSSRATSATRTWRWPAAAGDFWHPSARAAVRVDVPARTEGGGYLMGMGSHDIDYVCALFGEPEAVCADVRTTVPARHTPRRLDARRRRRRHLGAASCACRTACSSASSPRRSCFQRNFRAFEVYGSTGSLAMDGR